MKVDSTSGVVLGSHQVLLLSEHGIVIFCKVTSVGHIVLSIFPASLMGLNRMSSMNRINSPHHPIRIS